MRGSFTGAVRDKAGLFEVAAGARCSSTNRRVAPTIRPSCCSRCMNARSAASAASGNQGRVAWRRPIATSRPRWSGTYGDLYSVSRLHHHRVARTAGDIPALAHYSLDLVTENQEDVPALSADAMTASSPTRVRASP